MDRKGIGGKGREVSTGEMGGNKKKVEEDRHKRRIKKLKKYVSKMAPNDALRIGDHIDSGSFADVYKGVMIEGGKEVAIKVIQLDKSDEFCGQFLEIALLEECDFPSIVKHIGSYMDNSALYICMEYCDGGTVEECYTELDAPLPEQVIRLILLDTLLAIRYLHSKGILHRDIKSGNIMLNRSGSLRLADFGTAIKVARNLKASTFVGTPYFMAPEVIDNKSFPSPYSFQADIWSLGITALEMAEIGPPLRHLHPMRALFVISMSEAPTLQNRSLFSPEFNDVVSKCLHKFEDARPTASQLLFNHPFFGLSQSTENYNDLDSMPLLQDLKRKCIAASSTQSLLASLLDDSDVEIETNPEIIHPKAKYRSNQSSSESDSVSPAVVASGPKSPRTDSSSESPLVGNEFFKPKKMKSRVPRDPRLQDLERRQAIRYNELARNQMQEINEIMGYQERNRHARRKSYESVVGTASNKWQKRNSQIVKENKEAVAKLKAKNVKLVSEKEQGNFHLVQQWEKEKEIEIKKELFRGNKAITSEIQKVTKGSKNRECEPTVELKANLKKDLVHLEHDIRKRDLNDLFQKRKALAEELSRFVLEQLSGEHKLVKQNFLAEWNADIHEVGELSRMEGEMVSQLHQNATENAKKLLNVQKRQLDEVCEMEEKHLKARFRYRKKIYEKDFKAESARANSKSELVNMKADYSKKLTIREERLQRNLSNLRSSHRQMWNHTLETAQKKLRKQHDLRESNIRKEQEKRAHALAKSRKKLKQKLKVRMAKERERIKRDRKQQLEDLKANWDMALLELQHSTQIKVAEVLATKEIALKEHELSLSNGNRDSQQIAEARRVIMNQEKQRVEDLSQALSNERQALSKVHLKPRKKSFGSPEDPRKLLLRRDSSITGFDSETDLDFRHAKRKYSMPIPFESEDLDLLNSTSPSLSDSFPEEFQCPDDDAMHQDKSNRPLLMTPVVNVKCNRS